MRIRKMEVADLEQVHRIEEKSFSMPWSIDSFSDSMKKETNCYLVAEENAEILGYCGYWGMLDEAEICNVAVREDVRNRGIAKQMLKELMEYGQSRGITAFTLEARVGNLPAIAAYHKLGFLDAGIQKNMYQKPTEDALIMWKRFPLG